MTTPPSPPSPAADDPDESRDRLTGTRLVIRLQGLLRTARLYHETNQAYRQQLDDLHAALGGPHEDETTLACMAGAFYVNGVRLRPAGSQTALYRALQEEFECRELGAIRFLPGVRAEELGTFIRLLAAARTPAHGQRLPEAVAEAGVLRILPVRARDLGGADAATHGVPRDERGRARETFDRTVRGTRSLLMRTARTGRPAIRQARHLVQPIVDSIMKSEMSLVGLTAIKEHDEYTYVHCVNVSVIAVAMGQALGLPRPTLANLGVAGLLHDLGKLAVAPDVLHKPGRLEPDEWEQIRRHPLEGTRMVTRLPGLTRLTLDVMRVTLAHHRHVDGGGYPTVQAPRPMLALSRLVAVADCFDAMTGHRSYRARPFTGREALELLCGPESARYDPAALWALIRTIGLFPAGTVMLTSTGHCVLSVSPDPADPWRPRCRVLRFPNGTVPPEEMPVFWEPLPATEKVVQVLKPEEYPVAIERLLAA